MIHAGCNHTKKFMVFEACNDTNGISCNNLTTIHVSMITAPSFCVPCFQQKEAMIDAGYERIKRQLRDEIARIDDRLANGPVPDERASRGLRSYRAQCEDNIVQAKASRDLSIRIFRHEQGVWGDG